MNIKDFHVKYKCSLLDENKHLKLTKLIEAFLYNLILDNNIEDLQGLEIIVYNKYVSIKTRYEHYESRGLSTLVLNGGKEVSMKNLERTVRQPVYHIQLENIDNSHRHKLEGHLILKLNYVKVVYI